jgi:hypothetical protein
MSRRGYPHCQLILRTSVEPASACRRKMANINQGNQNLLKLHDVAVEAGAVILSLAKTPHENSFQREPSL